MTSEVFFSILLLYILGVWTSYFQLRRWSGGRVTKEDDYEAIFLISTLSWLVYPLYYLTKLLNQMEEK